MSSIPPERRLLTAVKLAELGTQSAKEAVLAEIGVTKAQYNALLILSESPGVSGAELAVSV